MKCALSSDATKLSLLTVSSHCSVSTTTESTTTLLHSKKRRLHQDSTHIDAPRMPGAMYCSLETVVAPHQEP